MRSTLTEQLSRRAVLCALSAPLLLPSLAPSPLLAAPDTPSPQTGIETPSGLQFIDYRKGTGATPRFGQLIRFHYTIYTVSEGSLTAIDNTYERIPYFTKHGNGYTCQGIEEALHSMRPGGRRRMILPPSLGYAIGDKGPVPPGPFQRDKLFAAVDKKEPIVYDLELLTVMDDLFDRGDYEDLEVAEANSYARDVLDKQRKDAAAAAAVDAAAAAAANAAVQQ